MNRMLKLIAGCTLAFAGTMMAAEDAPADHVQWMKDLGKQMGAMRKGVDVQKNATDMQATLKLVGGFWKKRNSDIAMKTCGETYKGAAAVAKAAAADDKEGIAAGMKQMGAMRKGVDVQKNATDMQATLKLVGGFWKKRNSDIAMKTCGETFKGAAAVAKAAAADDKEGIAAGMKMMGAGCKGCHDAHREKVGEHEYKIK